MEPTHWMWHHLLNVIQPNTLHLTFCEPEVLRLREERLKVPLGPLGSMLYSGDSGQTNLLTDPWRVEPGQSLGLSTLETDGNPTYALQSQDRETIYQSLKVVELLSPPGSLLLTDKTEIQARDINYSMTLLTHRPFSSNGNPVIRLNAASAYEASGSNG